MARLDLDGGRPQAAGEKPLELYVVRHGETMLNAAGRMQGWIDAPLTPAGERVAASLGRGLKRENIGFDGVFTSDTGRARQTAQIVLGAAGQDPLLDTLVTDWRLREANFGSFEGVRGDSVFDLLARELGVSEEEHRQKMSADPSQFTAHLTNTLAKWDQDKGVGERSWAAEPYAAVQARALGAISSITDQHKQKGSSRVLIVAHGVTISILLASLGAASRLPMGGFANASVSTVVYEGGNYVVDRVNDTRLLAVGDQ